MLFKNMIKYIYMIADFRERLQVATIRAGLCFGLFWGIPAVTIAQVQLNFPVPRIVFQRDNANQAAVPFRAVLTSTVTQVNVRLVVRQGGTTTNWMTFTPANGSVSGRIPSVQGGWYDLEVESFNGSVSLGIKRVQRIGVGEVLLASGQSNAQGFPYDTGASDDRVSCVNYYDEEITESRLPLTFSQLSSSVANVGPTNFLYMYGLLGDKLVQRLGVPVLIYGAALGGTSSSQWRQTAEGLLIPDATQWGGAEDLRPYRAIKATLNHYVQRTGLRAILWHQGESDKGMSGSAYVSNLQKLIEVSRQDAGVSTLPWVIARASWFNGGEDSNISGAQNQVIAQVPYCFAGPNTDVYNNSYRQDGTHFQTSFYPQLAELWNQSLSASFFQQSTPYALPQEPPRITVGQPLPVYQYAGGHLVIPFLDETPGSSGTGVFYTAQLLSASGQFVTNVGVGTTRPLRVSLPESLTGTYQIRLVSSAGGAPSTLSPPITVYAPTYPKGTGTGLTGQYTSGYDSNGPVLHTQVDGPIDFNWFSESPSPAMPIRDYIIRWTGEVEAPVTGTYTIKATYNDGARVWVNNQQLIDDWTAHPGPGTQRGQITLQANQRYTIRFDVLQRWYNAEAKLQWVVPGTTQAVYIPKDRLYPAVVTSVPEANPIQVAYPGLRAVLQRDNTNVAQLTISGTCPPQTERIEVRVTPTVSGYGQISNSYVLLDNQPVNGYFSGSIGITGGWYNLDVQAVAQSQVISHTRTTPVGVGEVFLIAGEANAQGITPMQSVADPTDDRVNGVPHFNYTDTTRLPLPPLGSLLTADQPVGPHGLTAWCWSELGDLLTKRLNVPVLFYNAAWAGTTMRNWRESFEQGMTTTITGDLLPVGMPYSNIKRVLKDYVPLTGLRAVLWQQGETEYYSTDPQALAYATDLQALIARSRSDAGFAQLPWVVARSSADNTTRLLYPSGSYEPVTNRQNQVIQTTAQVMAGPIVDTIQMPRPDGTHFRGSGLSRLAAAWDSRLTSSVLTAAPMLPQPPAVSDLRLSAVVNSRVKAVGSDIQFTLTVSNEGRQPVSNVRIRCLLPQNLQFISSASMTYQAGYLLASVPNLATGQQALLSFTARPQQPGSYWVAAEIIRADQLDQDSRPNTSIGNGEDDVAWVDFRTVQSSPALFSVSVSENAPVLPAVASTQPIADPNKTDLSLRLFTSRSTAMANAPISASLLVTNGGSQPAQSVQVGCSLPAGLSFSGSLTMNLMGSTVRGTVISIPAGGQGLLTFSVTPMQSGNWTLQAQIEAATPADSDSTPNNGFLNGEDDRATLSIRTP